MVLVMLTVAAIVAVGLFSYSATNSKLNARSTDYHLALAAAEASTEKVVAQINTDFRAYGQNYVLNNLDTYRQLIPTSSESSQWTNYDFMNLSGQSGYVEVTYTAVTNFVDLGAKSGA
jgi:Tfp pilus assembly protein PilX